MHSREIVIGVGISIGLSIIVFLLSTFTVLPGIGIFDSLFIPFSSGIAKLTQKANAPEEKVQEIQINTIKKTVDYQHLEEDNKALRDQFSTSETNTMSLLPAHIIGAPQFLPGVGQPESLILDQGSKSGIKKGQAVIFKNAIIGLVTDVHTHSSQVKMVSSTGISFPAKTTITSALGILKGLGNGDMVLDNVVLSDELKVGDFIESNMSQKADGTGYPPGLIIGKIVAVQKNPSSLFQRAQVKSIVDVTKVSIIFVVLGQK